MLVPAFPSVKFTLALGLNYLVFVCGFSMPNLDLISSFRGLVWQLNCFMMGCDTIWYGRFSSTLFPVSTCRVQNPQCFP